MIAADLRRRIKQARGRWRCQAWSFKYTGVDLAALGLSEQPTDEADPAAGAAQQDATADVPPAQGDESAQQDVSAAVSLVPGSAVAQQDANDHRPATSGPTKESTAAETDPAPTARAAQQDAVANVPPARGDETAQQDVSAAVPLAPGNAVAQQDATVPSASSGASPGSDWQLPDLPAKFAPHAAAIQFLVGQMIACGDLAAYMQANRRDNARLTCDRIVGDFLADVADQHLDAYAVLAESPTRGRLLDWLFDWYYSWANGLADTPETEPGQDAGDYRLAQLRCPDCGLEYHGLVGSRAAVPEPARCPRCGATGEEPGPDGNRVDDPRAARLPAGAPHRVPATTTCGGPTRCGCTWPSSSWTRPSCEPDRPGLLSQYPTTRPCDVTRKRQQMETAGSSGLFCW